MSVEKGYFNPPLISNACKRADPAASAWESRTLAPLPISSQGPRLEEHPGLRVTIPCICRSPSPCTAPLSHSAQDRIVALRAPWATCAPGPHPVHTHRCTVPAPTAIQLSEFLPRLTRAASATQTVFTFHLQRGRGIPRLFSLRVKCPHTEAVRTGPMHGPPSHAVTGVLACTRIRKSTYTHYVSGVPPDRRMLPNRPPVLSELNRCLFLVVQASRSWHGTHFLLL